MERWCNDFAASATYGGVCDVHRLQLSRRDRRLRPARGIDSPRREPRRWRTSTSGRPVRAITNWREVRELRGDADGCVRRVSRARGAGRRAATG